MKDSQHYIERSQDLMRLAHQLGGDAGDAYLQLASTYVELAREAAIFEAAQGQSLTGDFAEQA